MVPSTTSIKRSRVGNIDTERLLGRQGALVLRLRAAAEESRINHVMRAAELAAIENELDRRGLDTVRRTPRAADRERLEGRRNL